MATLAQLNIYWAAWVEQCYHRRVHSGTGQTPLERWLAGPTALRAAPEPDTLRQAFLWSAARTVTKTRTVSLHGNLYDVDPGLVGRRVALVYDPVDLTAIAVFDGDTPAGTAVPARLATHVDPKLRAQTPPQPGPATGIAYLDAVVADHAETLRGDMSYQPPTPKEDRS